MTSDYATFCEAVDMHLVSIGEPSRLIIDGEFTVIEEIKEISSGVRLLPEFTS